MPQAEPLSERQQADVRHRFANAFQLISALTRMRIQRTRDEESKRQLAGMLDAIGVIGLVQHRALGADPENLGELLREIGAQWRRRCAGRPLQLDLALSPVMAREHVISAVALIANELVSNALSHAFIGDRAGRIAVQLRDIGDGKAELIVQDDGDGYGGGYDGETADQNSLGLWLIKGLTQQVRGLMTVKTEGGVTACLEFATGRDTILER